MQDGAILVLERVRKDFGGLRAVDNCSFVVETGKIVGLIGPNGAGKTTLFQVISGVLKRDSGHIYFHGDDISRLPPHEIARRGIGRTFQITRIFPKMTVWENMIVASHSAGAEERAREMLELADLLPLKDHYAAELSFGQQKLLDLMRVMMLNPQLILLDEPAAGINPTMQNKILDLIHRLNDQGSTFLIIEHDMDIIMGHCEKVIALNFGRVIAEGRPDEVRENEEVLTAYFGK
ncbi:MAG: ABC transporter ATP-binding protein [Deltaproteobacteria bacterium]|nr:ABC transporter ATP-binding protein [Deltaproteobacteria bacterium]